MCGDDCIERIDAMGLKINEDEVSDRNGGNWRKWKKWGCNWGDWGWIWSIRRSVVDEDGREFV